MPLGIHTETVRIRQAGYLTGCVIWTKVILPNIIPPELNPQPWKNPRTRGSSPRIGLWSGVNDSETESSQNPEWLWSNWNTSWPGPQTVDLIPICSRQGTRLQAPLIWTPNTSQSSSYNPKAKSLATWVKIPEICKTKYVQKYLSSYYPIQ